MAKVTMKAKVLDFVESKGTAMYTEIIEFIVDTKFGEGTYKAGYTKDWDGKMRNSYRGYYSSAFTQPRPYSRGMNGISRYPVAKGYFLNCVGYGCLVKLPEGGYKTVR